MKKILQIVLAGLLLGTFSSANAVIINTSVGTYDVTLATGDPATSIVPGKVYTATFSISKDRRKLTLEGPGQGVILPSGVYDRLF